MDLTIKQVSSLEKILPRNPLPNNTIEKKTIMKGEIFSYQIAIHSSNNTELTTEIISPIKDSVKLYSVKNAVMDLPIYSNNDDLFPTPVGDFITKEPGIMPDILSPIEDEGNHIRLNNESGALWVTVKIPENIEISEIPVTIKLKYTKECEKMKNHTFETDISMIFDIIDIKIPEQKTYFSQWFHTDCIATAHNVPVYSEEHWDLIDKYMAMANELGINMILTPVITPPLDTGEGITRPCTQLVKIEKQDNNYYFDFSLLKRWISMAEKNNIRNFEISHLFSQWGLGYAPNIKIIHNGIEDYMFGWHTSAQSDEYREFLNQFIPSLIEFFKSEGIKDRCWFHISDEPKPQHLAAYKYAYDIIKPLIDGCPTMDAISNYEFYENGLISNPVTASDHINTFLDNNTENQWVYYCCEQYVGVGNRFLSMPSYRNRILGLQMYKYNIKGFLHWGFNFYYNQFSRKKINPYITSSCDKMFPSGDPFSVYPTDNGVIPSLRAVIFKEALNDIEICRKLESYIGREKVVEMIDKTAGMNMTFADYPKSNDFIPNLIESMERLIKEHTLN